MTREEAKELLPIIQAFADGNTIEFLNARNMWEELEDVLFCREPKYYRIKPEPKYRPFKTKEECWNEMMKHQPFGWLTSKKTDNNVLIGYVCELNNVYISFTAGESEAYSAEMLFDNYKFVDGTPFGICDD